MAMKYLDLMVTDSVRRAQKQHYGRAVNIPGASQRDPLGQDEAEFIMARDSFYLGSINETGWPYIQHRGGPLGFLRVVNETTLAFADYKGNRQLLTTGNVSVNYSNPYQINQGTVSVSITGYQFQFVIPIVGTTITMPNYTTTLTAESVGLVPANK